MDLQGGKAILDTMPSRMRPNVKFRLQPHDTGITPQDEGRGICPFILRRLNETTYLIRENDRFVQASQCESTAEQLTN